MSFKFSDFAELPSASCPNEFRAIPISLRRKDFIAKSSNGSPIFLLSDSNSISYYPSINFRYISVQFNVTCSVKIDLKELQGNFCIIEFTESSLELYEIFIKCISSATESLPLITNTKELESFILGLGELFRTLNSPSGKEISGLWAELFIIFISTNTANALKFWHNDPYDKFDFSNNEMRLEVKSTVRGIREHEFSLDQLVTHVNGSGFVASFLLKNTALGYGVFELATKIEEKVKDNPLLKQKLWENVIKALGADFSEKLDRHFDVEFARNDLVFYSMDEIPKPDNPNDDRVTALRFMSNLSNVKSSLSGSLSDTLERIFKGT